MPPIVFLAILWAVPMGFLVMLYIGYRQPAWWAADLPAELLAGYAKRFVRWVPLFLSVACGAILLGVSGWTGWPSVLTVIIYAACRAGGELGLWLRERRAAR